MGTITILFDGSVSASTRAAVDSIVSKINGAGASSISQTITVTANLPSTWLPNQTGKYSPNHTLTINQDYNFAGNAAVTLGGDNPS